MKIFTFLYSYLATLHRDTKGASAIEYAVIAGLMAVALIAALALLTGDEGGLQSFFNNIANTINGVTEGE